MARVVTTVEAVRARFSALQQPLTFFDAPGGTQVPDSVIDAISDYLRYSNANTDGPFATTKEVLAGYDILDCADLDEAIRQAARVPAARYGTIEVRPMMAPDRGSGS